VSTTGRRPSSSLREYKKKRDFKVTSEPAGKVAGRQKGRSFVIQKHHARRLHWDLRLEVNGVLASWAVPKEPPNNPGVRRLAVHVEDHPLEYGKFEGRIPEGEYGAGKVEIWDKGSYSTRQDLARQIEEGTVEFELHGERLEGTYILVRMDSEDPKEDNWLFFKKDVRSKGDERGPASPGELDGAKRARQPATLRPMLCATKKSPPKSEDWLREIKWDGYRVLAFIRDGKSAVKTRNGNPIALPEIQKVLDSADLPDGILDGELVAVDDRGVSNFKIAHADIAAKRTKDLVLYAFDLPFFDGWDLRECEIEDRKRLLEQLLERIGSERVRFSVHTAGDGEKLFQQACQTGLEGIISKRAGSRYVSIRSPNWVKTRCERQLEGWIGGFTKISSGQDAIGALLIGMRDEKGRLLYAGKVGTGFSEADRSRLFRELSELQTDKAPFETSAELPKRGVVWTEPTMPTTAQYLEWSEGGVMRQPKWIKDRPKRQPPTSEKEQERMIEKAPKEKETPAMEPGPIPIKITNPGRVMDAVSGLTKGDVAAYYHEVAPLIVPQLAGRPLPVLRCPDGIAGSCFFHKHWIRGLPDAVGKADIEEESGEDEPYMAIHDLEGLLALAQMGVVEFHPWGSRLDKLEQPDLLIFDLDPGEGMEWSAVVDAAHLVRSQIESLGLRTFAKLSGGKGVHIVLPILPELRWDKAKAFCEGFARAMAQQHPKLFTAELPKAKRKLKIFLDYLRNGRGATAVCAYSLRARPRMPVAMPVEWEEITEDVPPDKFDLRQALEYLRNRARDPWKDFGSIRQSLRKAIGLS
jgi:bifunctional non-homologous end joining protein LigD